MQTVIGAYSTDEEAQRAIRRLERHMSIQDIVIVDQTHPEWRSLMRKTAHARAASSDESFLVVMMADRATCDRALSLLEHEASS